MYSFTEWNNVWLIDCREQQPELPNQHSVRVQTSTPMTTIYESIDTSRPDVVYDRIQKPDSDYENTDDLGGIYLNDGIYLTPCLN